MARNKLGTYKCDDAFRSGHTVSKTDAVIGKSNLDPCLAVWKSAHAIIHVSTRAVVDLLASNYRAVPLLKPVEESEHNLLGVCNRPMSHFHFHLYVRTGPCRSARKVAGGETWFGTVDNLLTVDKVPGASS